MGKGTSKMGVGKVGGNVVGWVGWQVELWWWEGR